MSGEPTVTFELVGVAGFAAGLAAGFAVDALGAGVDVELDTGSDGEAAGLAGLAGFVGFEDGAGSSVSFAGLESEEW
jgi:hypothetical protein